MSRRAKLVLLCEDSQHEAFVRRFLIEAGWSPRAIRVEKGPRGRGAGDSWVLRRYPVELKARRSAGAATALVVVVDADRFSVRERLERLNDGCSDTGVAPRGDDEPVAILVPKQAIETWIAYLDGATVDEGRDYPPLHRERDCARHVRTLKQMCDQRQLRDPAPPSLEIACPEYGRLARLG
jgi:hypothetical protein